MSSVTLSTKELPIQLSTFRLGREWYGVDVLCVQEVMSPLPVTMIPLAPDYVVGLINVRGVLVTVISLKRRLEFAQTDYEEEHNLLIINGPEGLVCLLVDEIGDVIETQSLKVAEIPATLKGTLKKYVLGVFKQPGMLISYVDVMKLVDC